MRDILLVSQTALEPCGAEVLDDVGATMECIELTRVGDQVLLVSVVGLLRRILLLRFMGPRLLGLQLRCDRAMLEGEENRQRTRGKSLEIIEILHRILPAIPSLKATEPLQAYPRS